ncbi:hypothetical protein RM844_30660 [Streptomyces sp. DSM 44915]|uniref:Uncharacterized protein n=1 Tax=Streptomyces chisholmiae TaxID=3075540 RepID=A0ABU2K083_9ACTN|nr:hypothetical protein [Streptomyces sp. DSM 44915]MDT0270644.1 hypothetical protein [Streptomyces sp. DSM 44915]
MTDARLILVLPDREAAEEVAERVTGLLDLPEEPEPVRDALAGEDDAEDAQWLVVLEEPARDAALLAALTGLVEAHEGWLEHE